MSANRTESKFSLTTHRSRRPRLHALRGALRMGAVMMLVSVLSGCTAILSPINGVPAHRLPPQFHAQPKNNLVDVDISRLRQQPPREYLLDTGDVLGIYIQGVLGNPEEPPPYHIPDSASGLPPALGFPIPIREDGTLFLPLVPPISVRGLNLAQVETLVRKAYTIDQQILQEGQDRIIVTLMQERTYKVVVMRQDGVALAGGGPQSVGGTQSGLQTRGMVVALPAYQNDVLHALAETGGLPGLDAKNEIKILRGRLTDQRRRDAFVQAFYSQKPPECLCYPPLPEDPAIIKIPLRLPPGVVPTFTEQEITLETGDTILIEGRGTEVFYTGGLLGGGQHPLPRDYDLDVIQAIAITRGVPTMGTGGINGNGGMGMGGFGGGAFGGSSLTGIPPGQLFIVRKTPCNDQIIIAVDMNRALKSPAARPLIQPGDMIILQYRPIEEIFNFGVGTFFTFGIFQLLQNNND